MLAERRLLSELCANSFRAYGGKNSVLASYVVGTRYFKFIVSSLASTSKKTRYLEKSSTTLGNQ